MLWDRVTTVTVKNCFHKSGFTHNNLENDEQSADGPDPDDDLLFLAQVHKRTVFED